MSFANQLRFNAKSANSKEKITDCSVRLLFRQALAFAIVVVLISEGISGTSF